VSLKEENGGANVWLILVILGAIFVGMGTILSRAGEQIRAAQKADVLFERDDLREKVSFALMQESVCMGSLGGLDLSALSPPGKEVSISLPTPDVAGNQYVATQGQKKRWMAIHSVALVSPKPIPGTVDGYLASLVVTLDKMSGFVLPIYIVKDVNNKVVKCLSSRFANKSNTLTVLDAFCDIVNGTNGTDSFRFDPNTKECVAKV
jgi:hypothetical protein